MKKLLTITTAAALLAIPGTLQANIITFSNLPGPTDAAYSGSTEGIFTITPTGGSWLQGLIYGNPLPSIYAGPIGGPTNSTIQITDLGSTFRFSSLDYSSNNGAGTFEIQGFLGASMLFDQIGSLNASLPPSFGFTTLLGSNSGILVDRLTIEVLPGAGTTSINLDNIVVSAVPEGGATLPLLAIGLAGVFFWRKARIISVR
jgi:hypothetical protein